MTAPVLNTSVGLGFTHNLSNSHHCPSILNPDGRIFVIDSELTKNVAPNHSLSWVSESTIPNDTPLAMAIQPSGTATRSDPGLSDLAAMSEKNAAVTHISRSMAYRDRIRLFLWTSVSANACSPSLTSWLIVS